MNINNKEPKVSVIMPAYNVEKYVADSIDSVLNQTYENFELIIIDDCSTDNTFCLLSEIAKTDIRIKLYKNEKNLGVADTRNRGFELAEGEYVALLDSDDIWRSEKLEKQIALAKKTDAEIIYCSYAMIDEDGKTINKQYIVPEKADFELLLEENVIGCSTVMLSKHVYKKFRFMKEYYHEDYILWLTLLREHFRAVGLSEVFVDYRVMKSSRSGNKRKSAIMRWKIYREFLKMPLISAGIIWIKYLIKGIVKYF